MYPCAKYNARYFILKYTFIQQDLVFKKFCDFFNTLFKATFTEQKKKGILNLVLNYAFFFLI